MIKNAGRSEGNSVKKKILGFLRNLLTQSRKPEITIANTSTMKTLMTELQELSPEDTLTVFTYLMNHRVKVVAKFSPEEGDMVTHQSLLCFCGDYVAETEPTPLDVALAPVALVGHLHKNEIN